MLRSQSLIIFAVLWQPHPASPELDRRPGAESIRSFYSPLEGECLSSGDAAVNDDVEIASIVFSVSDVFLHGVSRFGMKCSSRPKLELQISLDSQNESGQGAAEILSSEQPK